MFKYEIVHYPQFAIRRIELARAPGDSKLNSHPWFRWHNKPSYLEQGTLFDTFEEAKQFILSELRHQVELVEAMQDE